MNVRHERPIRAVYFGTPEFAVPTLRRLADDPRFDVALAVTQPDRPAGRGRRLVAPPVKSCAESLGIPVYQPARIRTDAERQPLIDVGAEVFVVAAFGQIFGRKLLAIPRSGCLNLHASLLPAFRGASPIVAAIATGEERTGVTLMRMDPGLDTGPMIATSEVPIQPDDTAASLTERLASVAADLAVEAIPAYIDGQTRPVTQPPGATLTRTLTKADGWIDWTWPAERIDAHVRAMWPWPRAWTTYKADRGDLMTLQIHAVRRQSAPDMSNVAPGTVIPDGQRLLVAAGNRPIEIVTAQEAGGRPVAGQTLLANRRLAAGDQLGAGGEPAGRRPLVVDVVPG